MTYLKITSHWKEIVGKAFSPTAFDAYCHTLQGISWRLSFIVIHNPGAPTLVQRPEGLTLQHIKNLMAYYRDTQRWSAGPHLFVDYQQI